MSSSIRTGLNELLRIDPDIDGAVITLCDQPFVDSSANICSVLRIKPREELEGVLEFEPCLLWLANVHKQQRTPPCICSNKPNGKRLGCNLSAFRHRVEGRSLPPD